MFEKSTAAKRMDQLIWSGVGVFITGYTCWHFNLIPNFSQIQSAISGDYHTLAVTPDTVTSDATDPEAFPVNPASNLNHNLITQTPSVPAVNQSEPIAQTEGDFNSVWHKFSQDDKTQIVTKDVAKSQITTLDEQAHKTPYHANSEPTLLSTPDLKSETFHQFMEQTETADQRVTPAVHQEPQTPVSINPWADQSSDPWESAQQTKTIAHEQPKVERSTPHYNDVIQNNLSYNPARNKVEMGLIPGHQANSRQAEIRFINNEEPKTNTPDPFPTEPENKPLQKMNDDQLLLQQPIKTGTDTPAKSTTLNPQDEVLRLRELSQVYWNQPAQKSSIDLEINDLARKIFFDKNVHYLPAYKIAPGDQLTKVARKYDVPWEYLARLNQVNPAKIRAGDTLKVQQGPFSAIVDLSEFELTIHSRGYYVCKFNVGTGKNGASPIGTFKVKNKEVNPVYYGSDKVIDRDDPQNPLGERWLDIGNSFGIHGTNEPDSIGKAESKGCIRMKNTDVELVYDLLIIGSEVTIRE